MKQNKELSQVHIEKLDIGQWWHSKSRGEIDSSIKGAGIIGYAHGKLVPHHTAK